MRRSRRAPAGRRSPYDDEITPDRRARLRGSDDRAPGANRHAGGHVRLRQRARCAGPGPPAPPSAASRTRPCRRPTCTCRPAAAQSWSASTRRSRRPVRRPLLLWLHGGGFVAGSVYDLDHVCSRLAHLGGVTVVSLAYRLAPEHPFPAALHDTYDAMCWLAEHGTLIGGDGRLAAGRPERRSRAGRRRVPDGA